MNLKRFAIRGIVFLAVFVALCMFFSGTVRTITTPKVKLTTAKRGKLEERIELTCRPAFPDAEEIALKLPEDMSLTIVKRPLRFLTCCRIISAIVLERLLVSIIIKISYNK